MNFTLVPPPLRVAFVNAGCLVWNVLLDYIAHNANKDRLEEEGGGDAEAGGRELATLRRHKTMNELGVRPELIKSYPTHK